MRWPMVLGSQGHPSENEVAKQEGSREKRQTWTSAGGEKFPFNTESNSF